MDARCDELTTVIGCQFITLSVHLCVQHDGREAAHDAVCLRQPRLVFVSIDLCLFHLSGCQLLTHFIIFFRIIENCFFICIYPLFLGFVWHFVSRSGPSRLHGRNCFVVVAEHKNEHNIRHEFVIFSRASGANQSFIAVIYCLPVPRAHVSQPFAQQRAWPRENSPSRAQKGE